MPQALAERAMEAELTEQLSMYVQGLATRQTQDHLKDIYTVDVSAELISRVTDEVKELTAE